MKPNKISKEWIESFQEFMDTPSVSPPVGASDRLFTKILSDLNPRARVVFTKMAVIHLIVSTGTLFLCPQFGMGLISGMGMMALFMPLGDIVCMAACGGLFLGATTFSASLFLRPEEVKVVRKNRILQIALLSMLSFGAFVCLGADVIATFGMAWMAGAFVTGLTTLELGWLVRLRLRHGLV